MSGMFFYWQTARRAGELARAAAPYHTLGNAIRSGERAFPAAQHTMAVRLRELVAAYQHYQGGHAGKYHEAVQCVAACTAYWQGRNAMPCRWRQIRSQVMRFEMDASGSPDLSRRVQAVNRELATIFDQRLATEGETVA